MPNQQSIRMEDMSEAYLRALCAANGYSIDRCVHDNDGVDVTVKCKGKVNDESIYFSPSLDIQLKSSYSKIKENEDGSITYSLEVKNYKSLIDEHRMIPLILVVFQMHNDENLWIEQTSDWLKITKCAYWICLKGGADTTNTSTVNINIPAQNLLTKESLKSIMLRISKQEVL